MQPIKMIGLGSLCPLNYQFDNCSLLNNSYKAKDLQ